MCGAAAAGALRAFEYVDWTVIGSDKHALQTRAMNAVSSAAVPSVVSPRAEVMSQPAELAGNLL